MSMSRWLSIVGAVGGTAALLSIQVGAINQTWGTILAIGGLALTSFNERMHGGLSKKDDDTQ